MDKKKRKNKIKPRTNIGIVQDENENNDFVREPDKIQNEQLIQTPFMYNYHNNSYHDEEQQYQKAIQESILLAKMEEERAKQHVDKCNHRKSGTKNIMIILKRLSLLDEKVDVINKIIEPILNDYNECVIDNHNFDNETYVKIFTLLNSIRFKEIEKKLLETIFITQ